MQPYFLYRKFCNAEDKTSIDAFESDVAMAVSQGGEPLGTTHVKTCTKQVNGKEEIWVFLSQAVIWKS